MKKLIGRGALSSAGIALALTTVVVAPSAVFAGGGCGPDHSHREAWRVPLLGDSLRQAHPLDRHVDEV